METVLGSLGGAGSGVTEVEAYTLDFPPNSACVGGKPMKESPKKFIYCTTEKPNLWHLIPDTPDDRKKAIEKGIMYATWASLSKPYKDSQQHEPTRFGDFPLDFDDAVNPENALNDLRALCLLHLPELYGIDPYAISFFASGSKGFHAIIPARLFDAQDGDPYLPLSYKKIAAEWKERFNLQTLDLSLYNMKRGKMFRIANVKRSNGRYKSPLTLEEVRDLSIEAISELTTAPREVDEVEADICESEELGNMYRKYLAAEHKEIEKQKAKPPTEPKALSKEIPDCIKYILTNCPETKSSTNLLITTLATYFQSAGYSYGEAFDNVAPFLDSYPHSTGYTTPEARGKHFETQWGYIAKTPSYQKFRCEFMLGLGLPGSAFECKQCANHHKKDVLLYFPDVMAGAALRAVETYRRHIESPDQFIYMTFLTLLGAVLARVVTLDVSFQVQTRLYTILIGPSGRSRKSTVMSLLVDLFKNGLSHEFELDICWGVGSDVGLARRMNKSKSLVLATDEFKALTSKAGIKNSALLPTISSLFDKNDYSNCIKSAKDSIEITDGFLTMIAASTPETFEEIWRSEFTNIGLNNRLFLVPGTGEKAPLPKKIPGNELNSIKAEIGKILRVVGGGLELVFAEDAKAHYNKWYMSSLEDSVHAQRLEAYCLRLACILALNELKVKIDMDIIQKAIQLCDWQLSVRKVHDPVSADNKIAELEIRIRRLLDVHGPLAERELRQKIRPERIGMWYFKKAIKSLISCNDIAEFKTSKTTSKYRLTKNEV